MRGLKLGRRRRATRAQLKQAKIWDIPKCQAHTINLGKCRRYMDWLRHPLVKLERFLDRMEARRRADTSDTFE